MDHHLLGSSLALMAAVSWAFAMIFFKKSEKIPPLALNLFKNTVGIILMALTLVVLGNGFGLLEGHTLKEFGILALSGFIGITVADTLFFYSLNLVGVSIISIVDCLYSPFIIFFSFLMLSESLTTVQYVGAGMVLLAVLITSGHEPPKGRTRTQMVAGILLGALNMALMGFGIVIAKPVLNNYPMVWATLIRLAAGTAGLFLIILFMPNRKALFSVFRPSKEWKLSIPGSVLGAYLACILWIGGFKYTTASQACILNQSASIFAIILAALILKERLTLKKAVAVTIAMTGIVLVMLPIKSL